MAELTLAGLTLTHEDWESLDAESRILLLETLAVRDEPADDPYDSFLVFIEELAERFE